MREHSFEIFGLGTLL